MSLPRDGDDELEPRRGRAVPEPAPRVVDIVVDGVTLGTVDPAELTAEAQFELEEAQTALALLDWLARHAGADKRQARRTIGPMKVQAIVELAAEIAAAIGAAVEPPKARRRR